VIYLCQAPKSNAAYAAYDAALKDVAETRNDPVPLHLRNAPTRLMKNLGYGKGYKYAHDFENAQVEQEHFPPNLQGRRYYEPTGRGFEAAVRERLAWRDDRPPPSGVQETSVARARSIVPPSSVGEGDSQALAGEESQVTPEDDGAQVPRPAMGKRAGKPAKRGG
jgi:putative ATPase